MKERLFQFMQGRYGVDQLNNVLIIISIICFIINMFVGNIVIGILAYLLWFIVIFRMLSKNIYVRNQENEKFLNYIKPITIYIKLKNVYNKILRFLETDSVRCVVWLRKHVEFDII